MDYLFSRDHCLRKFCSLHRRHPLRQLPGRPRYRRRHGNDRPRERLRTTPDCRHY